MKWFRFYSEFIDDPKTAMMSDTDQLIWVKLLCLANLDKSRGQVSLTDEEIAWRLRVSVETWKHAKDKFRAKGMIEPLADGVKISKWDDRQFDSDSSAQRTRKYRDRKRSKPSEEKTPTCDVTTSSQERHRDGLYTDPDPDPDPEADTETDPECVNNGAIANHEEARTHDAEFCNSQSESKSAEPVQQNLGQPTQSSESPGQAKVAELDTIAPKNYDEKLIHGDLLDSLMAEVPGEGQADNVRIHPAMAFEMRMAAGKDGYPWKRDRNFLGAFIEYLANTHGRKGEPSERRRSVAVAMIRKANFASIGTREYMQVHQSWLLFLSNARQSATVEEATGQKSRLSPATQAFLARRRAQGVAQ